MTLEVLVLSLVVCGLGAWFSLAVFNNVIDFNTNRFLIAKMISMEDIIQDPNLGNGIQWRAINGKWWPSIILVGVISYQLVVVLKSVLAGAALVSIAISGAPISDSLLFDINTTLVMWLMLWLGFLTGGLWFGYWLKMQQLQAAHIMLTIIALLSLVLVNTIVRR